MMDMTKLLVGLAMMMAIKSQAKPTPKTNEEERI